MVLIQTLICFVAATMTKIIKEMLPPDVRVARDTQDLLIECCVGEMFIKHSSRLCANGLLCFDHLVCGLRLMETLAVFHAYSGSFWFSFECL